MNLVSYILTLLVKYVLSDSGLPSTSSKIKVRGTVIKNGQNVVRGVEGEYLKIVCIFKSQIPTMKFLMNINGLHFERIGNGRLRHSFIPSRNDNMKYVQCSASSPFLHNPMSSKVLLDIQYSPVVKIVEEVTEKRLILICYPSGNPDSYTFADWQHWSEFKERIRNIQGTPNGTLSIWESNNNNSLPENDGIYKCKTSNGIYGTNGRLYQKELALIHSRVAPVFMNANDPIKFGCYGQEINVSVLLYNKYGTLQTSISKSSKPLNKKGIQTTVLKREIFHGVNVTVAVINIKFQLTLDGIDDFTDYTIKACNNKGCNVFTVKVTSTCRPEPPQIVSVIPYARYLDVVWDPGFDGGYQQTFFVEYRQETETIWRQSKSGIDNTQNRMSSILNEMNPKTRYHVRVMSKNKIGESKKTSVTSVITLAESPESPTNVSVIPYDSYLEVSWCPEFNGGDPQTFFIEYQQVAGEKWTRSGPFIDNMQSRRMSNLLYNMTPNTQYLVRMFSRNEIGESKKTTVVAVMTLEPMINLYRVKAVFVVFLMIIAVVLSKDVSVAVLVVLAVTIAVYGLITFFCLRRKDEDVSDNYDPVEEEVRENFQVEPVDNQLYISSDDPNLASVHNIRNQSVIDTTLPSTSRDNQIYQIQLLNEGSANGRRSCTYINRGAVSAVLNPQDNCLCTVWKIKIKRLKERSARFVCQYSGYDNRIDCKKKDCSIDDPNLNYSEITFNTVPTMRDAVIHGSVNRIYSEIDLMADPVAPLSSSESEYDESDDSDT